MTYSVLELRLVRLFAIFKPTSCDSLFVGCKSKQQEYLLIECVPAAKPFNEKRIFSFKGICRVQNSIQKMQTTRAASAKHGIKRCMSAAKGMWIDDVLTLLCCFPEETARGNVRDTHCLLVLPVFLAVLAFHNVTNLRMS
jgi:hypothetical protein